VGRSSTRPARSPRNTSSSINDGLITQGEKYNKVVDAWAKCTDKLAEEMMKRISSVKKDEHGRDKPINSIYMMSHSGRAVRRPR
jgi:DNA-directed RNA polymerase beta' subunit